MSVRWPSVRSSRSIFNPLLAVLKKLGGSVRSPRGGAALLTTLLIDREGRIRTRQMGFEPANKAAWVVQIEALLQQEQHPAGAVMEAPN